MSEPLITIQAPVLNGSYGQNVKETFDNIDANFGILSNKNLYKGDAGSSLISISIPWSVLLASPSNPSFSYLGYTFKNYYTDIYNAFATISTKAADLTAVISQLTSSGSSVVVSFSEPEEDFVGNIEFKTITPYVFIDSRFRQQMSSSTIGQLAQCTDMSCVVCMDYVGSPTPQYIFVCKKSFPSLYYDDDDSALYWIINEAKTKIRADGPPGRDGTTGNFYTGITFDNPNFFDENQNIIRSQITISFLLYPKALTPEQTALITPGYESYLPFLRLVSDNPDVPSDYAKIVGVEPTSGASIIVLKALDLDNPPDAKTPYYISYLTKSSLSGEWISDVSIHNVCYAYLTDTAVKAALLNNVRIYSQSIASASAQLPGYPIRNGEGRDGYEMLARPGTAQDPNPSMEFVYVENLMSPDTSGSITSGSFKFIGKLSEGYNSKAYGAYSHAEGSGTQATGSASHAEGISSKASGNGSHAEGNGTTASGHYAHAEGTKSKATGTGSHAEGNATSASGLYTHAEGVKSNAAGSASHAEGNSTNASGDCSHAENSNTQAIGSASHAEGVNSIASGSYSHAGGYNTQALSSASCASGFGAIASGLAAMSHGYMTTTSNDYEVALGKFNQTGYLWVFDDYSGSVSSSALFDRYFFNLGGFISPFNDGEFKFIPSESYYSESILTAHLVGPVMFSVGVGSESARRNVITIADISNYVLPSRSWHSQQAWWQYFSVSPIWHDTGQQQWTWGGSYNIGRNITVTRSGITYTYPRYVQDLEHYKIY